MTKNANGSVMSNVLYVGLTTRFWGARTLDDDVNTGLADDYGLESKAYTHVLKRLLPKHSSYNEVRNAQNQAHAFWQENSLPVRKGLRLMASKNLEAYNAGKKECLVKFQEALHRFARDYPILIEEHKQNLKGMYDATDYPPVEYIVSRFALEFEEMPVPSTDAFLQITEGVSPDEMETLKNETEKRMQAKFESATRDLWTRGYTTIKKLVAQLADPKNKVKDKTIDNALDLVDLLKRLNFANDEALNQMMDKLKDTLTGVTGSALRSDKAIADQTHDRAKSVLFGMEAIMKMNAEGLKVQEPATAKAPVVLEPIAVAPKEPVQALIEGVDEVVKVEKAQMTAAEAIAAMMKRVA